MAGGDEGDDSSSNGGVIADLPQDHPAEPARVRVSARDLGCGLVEQTIAGNPLLRGDSDQGGTGGGHFELQDEASDRLERFLINDYLAQARSRRCSRGFSTASKTVVLSDLGASVASADRMAYVVNVGHRTSEISHTYSSRIVRRPSETAIIQHLNNMADRGMYTTVQSHFELDTQGHLVEIVGHQHDDAQVGQAECLPWYAHPIQRQRWNEDHVLPHVDWGDLFFDLFYVGAGEKVTCYRSSKISISFV